MDQIKIGNFLKELRKEREFTQEQLAEHFGVSRRTVSLWETGSNMPDLDLLMEMSDFYEVDLRELLDGERKSERMNRELEETVIKVAEYTNEEQKKASKVMLGLYIISLVALAINTAMELMDINEGFWAGFLKGGTVGIAVGTMIFGILFITGRLTKTQEAKKRLLKRK